MRMLIFFFAAALLVVSAGTTRANPNDGVKSSPLFKASLQESIAKMENKAAVQSNYADANGNMLATSAGAGCVSPNLPATEISTCQPSVCGGATCYSTCSGQNTCYNTCGNTCASTCQNTCSQNTCSNTCAGGNCPYDYRFQGYSYWNYNGNRESNWYNLTYPPCYFKQSRGYNYIIFFSNPPGTIDGTGWETSSGGPYYAEFWYNSKLNTTYEVRTDLYMRALEDDPWTDWYSYVTVTGGPDYQNINYCDVDFYFYGD